VVIEGISATGHQAGPDSEPAVESARWAWLVVGASILVAVTSEVVVVALTSRLAHGLADSAWLVALVGCAVAAAGFAVSLLVEKRRPVPVGGSAAGLVCAAGISVVLGEVWLLGGRTLLWATGVVVAVVGLVGTGARLASVSRSSVLWLLCASGMALGVTAALRATPDALTLSFRWKYEAQLNRLVPVANALLANSSSFSPCRRWSPPPVEHLLGTGSEVCGVPGQFDFYGHGWSINFNTEGADTCERHLDGPWWENVGNGVTCPAGFQGIGGG
jgi:hypothetical protein